MPAPHLYLVRHARAEQDHPEGDAARRLTREGRAAFHSLVTSLGPRLRIERIVTSPLVRARQTADELAAVTGAPVEEDGELASGACTGRELLTLARRAGAGVALVGHNPEIAEAIALAAGREEKVRPGTIAALVADRTLSVSWLEAPNHAK